MKTSVRAATNKDGEEIKRLLAASDQDLPVAFDDVEGFWLVAERNGLIVGCLQICYGRPIGSLEMMALDSDLSVIASGQARWELALTGMAMLHRSGASYVRCFIPFRDKAHKNALKKRGAKVADNGNMMLRRLR